MSFLTKKGVNIVTPYLTTTLAPPPTLVDPSLSLENPSSVINESRRKAALAIGEDGSDDDGLDTFEEVPSGPEKQSKGKGKRRRPKAGEIKFWATGIEVDKDGKRNEYYGWNDIGDEISTVLTEREITTRQAIWSPSGLSDLGGSLLVVLSSSMQVSVYAPRNDPYTKQWDEIADLTSIIRGSLPSTSTHGGLSVEGNLEMRTMCLQWSSHLPLPSLIGVDGSILALGNRAGTVSFWNYGPEKHFRQLHYIQICEAGGWVSDMAWSEWNILDNMTCEAHLALSMTDGSIRITSIRRQVEADSLGKKRWNLEVQEPVLIDRGDKRFITSLRWVDVRCPHMDKVWNSAHFAAEGNATVQWHGIVALRLKRVGNWASANALGPCVGIHRINRDTIIVVLSSLTSHIITDFAAAPRLAHPHESLRAALALRDMFEDHLLADPLIKMRYRSVELQTEGWTANTTGWTSLGWGGVGSWVTEPISFHTLDSATEGKRSMNFVLGNMGKAIPAADSTVFQALQAVLSDPPNLLLTSSGRVLLPYLLHINSLKQPESISEQLLTLLDSVPNNQAEARRDEQKELVQRFWSDRKLNGFRLAFVLASWCTTAFSSLTDNYQQLTNVISSSISACLLQSLLGWFTSDSSNTFLGNLDRQFIDQIIKAAHQLPGIVAGDQLSEMIADATRKLDQAEMGRKSDEGSEERCPACRTEVGSTGVCAKGHVWSRCSITQLLITHPHYRVCSTCPAISLLPKRHLASPVAVDEQGRDYDYQRFIQIDQSHPHSHGGDDLIQIALEAAIGCIKCGGRWQRAV